MATTKPRRPATRPGAKSSPPYAKWAGIAIGVLLVVGVVALMFNTPEEVPDGIPAAAQEFEITDASHVPGAVDYDRLPPAGGPHNEVPLQCGIYEEPVPTENAVHSLEHGAVWITYLPDIGSGAINTLENASRVRSKTILSPFPGQSAPVIVSAWGWQMEVQDAGDVSIRQFIQAFEGADSAPEPMAAC